MEQYKNSVLFSCSLSLDPRWIYIKSCHDNVIVQYFIPAYRNCPVQYLKDLLAGRKMAMKIYELSEMHVPNYPEFGVKIMYHALAEDDTVSKFIPNYRPGHLSDKIFLHKLICSLYPEQMYNLITQANKNRIITNDDCDGELIEIAPEIAAEIECVVMLPTKPGRTLHLLKKKAKGSENKKQPRKFQADYATILGARPNEKVLKKLGKIIGSVKEGPKRNEEDMRIDSIIEEEKTPSKKTKRINKSYSLSS